MDNRITSVTLEDVARTAGVSRSQTSRALRNDPGVKAKTKEHILSVARSLNYQPNIAARSLASRQSHVIGIIVEDILNPFEAMLARECDVVLRSAGYAAMLSMNGGDDAATLSSLRGFADQRVAGTILIGTPNSPSAIVEAASMLPTVYIARDLTDIGIESVSSDDALGARFATEHLISLGHTAIAHISGGRGAGAEQREKGYRQAVADAGLLAIVANAEYNLDAGSAAADRLMARKHRPTAIFVANDLAALGAINRLASLGYRIPEDVAIVGFDDITLAASETIALTTVRQPVPELIRSAVEILRDRLAEPKRPPCNRVLEPELVVRRSSGTVRSTQ